MVGSVVSGTFPNVRATLVVNTGDVVNRAEVGGRREGVGERVSSEELPDEPTSRPSSHCRVGGKLNDGNGPLPAVHVAQDGGVEGTGDAVGVALIADHRDGLTNSSNPPWKRLQIAVPADSSVGVCSSDFADDVAEVVVEAVELVNQSVGGTVRVVVTNGRSGDVMTVRGSTRRDDSNVRVGLVDSLHEQGEAVLLVGVPSGSATGEPVLVTDLDVLQREGLRVAQLSTASTPLGSDGTANELNLVESIVDERLELVLGGDVTVQGKTGKDTNN